MVFRVTSAPSPKAAKRSVMIGRMSISSAERARPGSVVLPDQVGIEQALDYDVGQALVELVEHGRELGHVEARRRSLLDAARNINCTG